MVKTLNCYLYAKKKVMALCLRVQFFLVTPVQFNRNTVNKIKAMLNSPR